MSLLFMGTAYLLAFCLLANDGADSPPDDAGDAQASLAAEQAGPQAVTPLVSSGPTWLTSVGAAGVAVGMAGAIASGMWAASYGTEATTKGATGLVLFGTSLVVFAGGAGLVVADRALWP